MTTQAELQTRIDSLDASAGIKTLLKYKSAAQAYPDMNLEHLDSLIAQADTTVDGTTTDNELIMHSRAQNPYPFVTKLIEGGGGFVNEYPYDYLTGKEEVVNGGCGQSGSTWWCSDTAIGRVENGVDVVYLAVTYEAPEDKSADAINKSKGEAVIAIKRLEVETDPMGVEPEFAKWQERGINVPKVSYVADEHHQPAMIHNKQNGQLIVGWGGRNSAVPVIARQNQYIMYGKTLETLSTPEAVQFNSTANYLQFMGSGNYIYAWSRVNINQWWYSRGAGGQNFEAASRAFLDAGQDLEGQNIQYYLNQKWIDAHENSGDGQLPDRSRVHCFGQGHPTRNPDQKLRYLLGEFVLAGDYVDGYNQAGLYYTKPTTDTAPAGNGRLGDMATITPDDMETAYTAPAGKSYRLLDVQTGIAPRALIVEFTLDWDYGGSAPLGTTYDLKIVQFNEWDKTWTVTTLMTDVRGALGYKPWKERTNAQGDPIFPAETGQESYSSLYVTGACFYRGSKPDDTLPIVYLAHRIGDDMHQHRLTEFVLTDDYSAVASTTDLTPLLLPNSEVDWSTVVDGVPAYKSGIQGSRNIIYRPDAIIGGNKRGLRVDMGLGWSQYGSYSAEASVLFRDYDAAPPKVTTTNTAVNAPVGTTVRIGVTAVSNAGPMTYVWEFMNSGDVSWSTASATEKEFDLYLNASSDGRQYRCKVTNSEGTTTSTPFTITHV